MGYNPSVEDKRALDEVIPRLSRGLTDLTAKAEYWNDFYRKYRAYFTTEERAQLEGYSSLYSPTAFSIIETVLPRLLIPIFEQEYLISMLPVEVGDVKPAKLMTEYVNFQLWNMDIFRIMQILARDMLMFGTAIAKIWWKFELRQKKLTIPEMFLGYKIGEKKVNKAVISYDAPMITPVDIYDFMIDPRATCIEDAQWCIQRSWISKEKLFLLGNLGIYKNVNFAIDSTPQSLDEQTKAIRGEVSNITRNITEDDKNKVELTSYYRDEYVIILANRSIVIKEEENTYTHGKKPFVELKDTELSHEFYGLGEIEPISDLIDQKNDIRNTRMDNYNSIVNRILVVDPNADVDIEQIRETNRAGGIMLASPVTSVVALQQQDVTKSSYIEEDYVSRDIQDAIGVWEYLKGGTPTRQETATGIMKLQEAGAIRLSLKMLNFTMNGLVKIVNHIKWLDEQYETKSKFVRILGQDGYDFIEVKPEDIAKNYDIKPVISIYELSRDAKRQQLLQLTTVPLFQMPNIKFVELQKRILELFNIKDINNIVGEIEIRTSEAQTQGEETKGVPSTTGVGNMPIENLLAGVKGTVTPPETEGSIPNYAENK